MGLKRHFPRSTVRDQRGITGLETAIILIAFVVVASVFAYTVLTAGIFSSQKANETVNAAIDEVRSSVTVAGNSIAYKATVDLDGFATTTTDTLDAVGRISVTVAGAIAGIPIDLTPAYQINPTNLSLEPSGFTNTLVINYFDSNQVINDMAWTVGFTGANDGDFSMEMTEKGVITIWMVRFDYDNAEGLYYRLGSGPSDPFIDDSANLLTNFDPFTLEISPVQGAPLIMEKVVPQSLNDVMNLR